MDSLDDSHTDYSPERNGPLLDYLRQRVDSSANPLFRGPAYFFDIQQFGLLLPDISIIRLNRSPLPDPTYFVNQDFLLESSGPDVGNMSCIEAPRGIYDPRKVLDKKDWSIHGLNLELLFPDLNE